MSSITAHEVHIQPKTVTLQVRSIRRCARLMRIIASRDDADSFVAELDRRRQELKQFNITLPDKPAPCEKMAEKLAAKTGSPLADT